MNASSGGSIGALIDGRLHLLKELINVHQVVLGSQVWHWWKSIVMGSNAVATVTIDGNHLRASWDVVTD